MPNPAKRLAHSIVACSLGLVPAGEAAASPKQTVIYSLTKQGAGSKPGAALAIDGSGNLYSATESGGAGYGTIFELTKSGKLKILRTKTSTDGYIETLAVDAAGNVFGTTSASNGVLFSISKNGLYTVLHTFGGSGDGAYPRGGLTIGGDGTLYGVTGDGGEYGYGVLYSLSTAGAETILHNFNVSDGAGPTGTAVDPMGNFFGTTYHGGSKGYGTVYELTAAGAFSVLFNFTNGPDGSSPAATLILDKAGNLYGTTFGGGAKNGQGTIFKFARDGTETVLADLGGNKGGGPNYAPAFDALGNIYATTSFFHGGAGNLVEVTPSLAVKVVKDKESDSPSGSLGTLVSDGQGNVYGTSDAGGANNLGTLYKVSK